MAAKWSDGFDFYAVMGVTVPGATLLFGASLFIPELGALFTSKDFGVGNLGLFIVIAYVGGQAMQAVGNMVEWLWWLPWRGNPTDWVRAQERRWQVLKRLGWKDYLADHQVRLIETRLHATLGLPSPCALSSWSKHAWYGLTRQIHAAISAQGSIDRIEKFNAIYGLNRGMAAAFIGLVVALLIKDLGLWAWAICCGVLAVLFLARMHRFGITYARELFVQFLQLPIGKDISNKTR